MTGRGGKPALSAGLFLLLALAAGLGQGNLHIILPALGGLARDFDVPFGTAQLSLTLTMLAMAVTTLFAGVLADRFGRRPVFLAGLVLLIAGGVVAVLAGAIWQVVAGRMVQGAGGVSLLVVGRAILRDRARGRAAARGMSYLVIGQALGPAVSPVIGSVILQFGDWRGVIAFPTAIGLALLVAALRGLEETSEPGARARPGAFWPQAAGLLGRAEFWLATAVGTATLSIFFSLITSGSWAVSEKFGLSPMAFAMLMLTFSASFVAGNYANGRLVERFGPIALMSASGPGVMAAVAVFALLFAGAPPVWAYLPPSALFAFSNGFLLANSVTLAISIDPRLAGTASGLVLFFQLVVSGIASQLVGMRLPVDDLPVVTVALLLAAAVLAVSLLLIRRLSDRYLAQETRV